MVLKRLDIHLAHSWSWIVLRGVLAIVFGLLCLLAPGFSLTALVFFWGAYALVDGAFALAAGFYTNSWQMTGIGMIGITVSVLTFVLAGISGGMLLALIAIWALIAGGLDIAAAMRFRVEVPNEWLLILSGAVSVVFGVLMLLRLDDGALAVVGLIGGFSVLCGVLEFVHGLQLRGIDHRDHAMPRPA